MTIAMSLDPAREGIEPRSVPGRADADAVPADPRRLSDVELVPVASLRSGDSPRTAGVDLAHVRVLAELDVALPPLIVHRRTMRVIDGAHRLRAAVSRGWERIHVRFFDGDESEAFVLAVAANNAHGLPLSLAERSAAAARILRAHPEWSDRAVASVAGISAGTVRGLRTAGDTVPAASAVRVGRDGRARPVNSAEGRLRAAELLERSPELSLRAVSRQSGISLGTVRDVRQRLVRGAQVVPASQHAGPGGEPPRTAPVRAREPHAPAEPPAVLLRTLLNDPSLRLNEEGRYLLRLLMTHQMPDQQRDRLAACVPPHAVPAVSEAARRCARAWEEFATRLAERGCSPASARAIGDSRVLVSCRWSWRCDEPAERRCGRL
jgi:hypothetical protein